VDALSAELAEVKKLLVQLRDSRPPPREGQELEI
jgi:hypothetical protein